MSQSKKVGVELDGIFIGGCDRSGTTLLLSILNAHEDIVMSYEASLPTKLYSRYSNLTNDKITELLNLLLNHPAFSGVGIKEENIRQHIGEVDISFQAIIRASYLALAEIQGKTVWGDKSPDYVLNFDLLAKLYPNSALIHIYRDPRAVVNSLLAQRWGPNTAKHVAKYWHKKVSSGIDSFQNQVSSHQVLSVCYETLVSSPETEVAKICDFLKIAQDERMLESRAHKASVPRDKVGTHMNIGQNINKKRIDSWKFLPKRDIRVIEAICGELMDQLGYERSLKQGAQLGLFDHIYYKLQGKWRMKSTCR